MKQMTLAVAKTFGVHGRATRKVAFLVRMETTLILWAEFCALIEPHYPKADVHTPPVGLGRMLRMYLVANWFNLADEVCENALYDIPAFRDFCRIDLGRERVPDATTLLNFRYLLEKCQIGADLFAKVGELLQSNGMKVHIGADSQTGLVHSARDFTNKRACRNRPLTDAGRKANRRKSSVRSRVGHPFLTLKRFLGFSKARYRGLARNANRAFAMLALINLGKWGMPFTGQVRPT